MNIKEIQNLKKISAFYGEYAIIETKDEKFGLINRYGDVLVPADKYERINYHCEDVFSLWSTKANRPTFYNTKLGKEVAMPECPNNTERELPESTNKFVDAYWCAENRIAFALYGIMDEKGNIIVQPTYNRIQYGDIYGCKNIRIRVEKDGLDGYVDLDGNVVIPFQYPFVSYNKELGLYRFRTKEKKWGIMDEEGQVIIPAIYDSIDIRAPRGLDEIAVTKGGRCYFINAKQEEVKVF